MVVLCEMDSSVPLCSAAHFPTFSANSPANGGGLARKKSNGSFKCEERICLMDLIGLDLIGIDWIWLELID